MYNEFHKLGVSRIISGAAGVHGVHVVLPVDLLEAQEFVLELVFQEQVDPILLYHAVESPEKVKDAGHPMLVRHIIVLMVFNTAQGNE